MLQYLKRITDTRALPLSCKEQFHELISGADVEQNVQEAHEALAKGDKEGFRKAKSRLPSIMWVGVGKADKNGTLPRKASELKPTQLVMIDIDHCKEDPRRVWEKIREKVMNRRNEYDYKIRIVHITPSGQGLRIVFEATKDFTTLKAHMDWFVEEFELTKYGDYDSACKDFSRQSYLVPASFFLFIDDSVFEAEREYKPIKSAYYDDGTVNGTDERTAESCFMYRGHALTEIARRYVEVFGEPIEGERHNYYNTMVKYFRYICDNDWQTVLAVLPRFGHTEEECRSQCKSICRVNLSGTIPKKFFLFLIDNGFYPKQQQEDTDMKALLEDETEAEGVRPPTLPPVFREFCATCPEEFILPVITALMPIMGTLTSYIRGFYMDHTLQSTTFFSCIYAPPGSGKSFASRLIDIMFKYLRIRDTLASMREQLFLTKKNAKSSMDKDPKDPHVSVRIMPAINSQPEFLEKMRDNKGYHMFTFAEEVDTFKKGTKAAGGDKSDLFRVAWDNAEYGQSFKSAATFKGMVRIYYNILLTGTPKQVTDYYNNVENGMVTRVSFCEIKNQEFGKFKRWKKLQKKQLQTIEKFLDRCDRMTYKEPLDYSVEDAQLVEEEDFDDVVPWRYNYRPFTEVDMSWLYPHLEKWLEDERIVASMQMDYARDTFRRRTAVKGFRLAMICMALWENITDREKKIIRDFVIWWMDYDIEASLSLFGKKFNELMNESTVAQAKNNGGLYAELPEVFTKADIVSLCLKMRIRTPARKVTSRWVKENLIVKIDKNKWKKK